MTNLVRVIRLDGRPLTRAQFTPEGYLDDRPILTCTGIFEYLNDDGTVRRELRPPEEVFAPESLESYRGKPIIVTHDAGLIDKDNISKHSIGTILTNGYRDGDNVRAEIMIHSTDKMKASGLKELSLGYNLDLDETPGEYNGQPYDAVQRNIRINHLALVENARAGDQARLNIDSRDPKKGVPKTMKNSSNRADGVLTPEELAKAIEEFKIKYHSNGDEDTDEPKEDIVKSAPAPDAAGAQKPAPAAPAEEKKPEAPAPAAPAAAPAKAAEEEKPESMEDQVKAVRGRHEDDGDVQKLCDIIDTLLAQRDFNKTDSIDDLEKLKGDEDDVIDEEKPEDENLDSDDLDPDKEDCDDLDKKDEDDLEDEEHVDGDDEDDEDLDFSEDEDFDPADLLDDDEKEDPQNRDENKDRPAPDEFNLHPGENPDLKHLNADSIDAIVRERVKVCLVGKRLHLDGLETMRLMDAKKAVVRAVRPNMRLDGVSESYVNAAYDCAVDDISKSTAKDTRYQKKQMFNKKVNNDSVDTDSAAAARERMKARQAKNGK